MCNTLLTIAWVRTIALDATNSQFTDADTLVAKPGVDYLVSVLCGAGAAGRTTRSGQGADHRAVVDQSYDATRSLRRQRALPGPHSRRSRLLRRERAGGNEPPARAQDTVNVRYVDRSPSTLRSVSPETAWPGAAGQRDRADHARPTSRCRPARSPGCRGACRSSARARSRRAGASRTVPGVHGVARPAVSTRPRRRAGTTPSPRRSSRRCWRRTG